MPNPWYIQRNIEEKNALLTQSLYIWTISSTNSTESPLFLCDSLISSAFPPLLSMKLRMSSVMVVGYLGVYVYDGIEFK